MSNYEQRVTNCGVNICKIYRQVSNKWFIFIWSDEEKSIEYNLKKGYALTFYFDFGAMFWGMQKASKIHNT